MDKIDIREKKTNDGWDFQITISGNGATEHQVKLAKNYYEKIKAHLTLDILNLRQEIKNLSLRHTRKDKTYYVME